MVANECGSRKVLLTSAGPAMQPVLEVSIRTFKYFALRFGYEVVVASLSEESGAYSKQARFAKLYAIYEQLHRADTVLWVDVDAIIRRFDRDITTELKPGTFQMFVMEKVPSRDRINPNSGVWLLRSGKMAFLFFDRLFEIGIQPGNWADQGTILRALDWHLGDPLTYRGARPGPGNQFTKGTDWLPLEWNSLFAGEPRQTNPGGEFERYNGMSWVPDPRIVHFAGMKQGPRLAAMKRLAATVDMPALTGKGCTLADLGCDTAVDY